MADFQETGLALLLEGGTLLPPYSIIGVDPASPGSYAAASGATPSKNPKYANSFSNEIRKSELIFDAE
jgi:hypothetical protein